MIAQDETFTGLIIHLDGGTFIRCRFERCRMMFSGLMPMSLVDCHSDADCTYLFDGPAQQTIHFMQSMYSASPSGRELIEATFEFIRKGHAFRPAPVADPKATN